MRTGTNGRLAVFWGQTEIDGLEAAPLSFLRIGAAWSWRGRAQALGCAADLDAGPMVSDTFTEVPNLPDDASGLLVLTNGAQVYTAHLFLPMGETNPLLIFDGECPARDQEFWISAFDQTERQGGEAVPSGNTVIAFPSGPKARALELNPPMVISVGGRKD